MVGTGWFALRRNPALTLRKAENISDDRLMVFSRETLRDFFRLLRQTMDAVKLQERHHLIYIVDETGLKLRDIGFSDFVHRPDFS
jgi:uroporphyrinogen-III synthase